MKNLRYLILVLFFAAILSACSLAGDVTPPPGSRQQFSTPFATQASGPLYPLLAPDPDHGASIYADKCSACHGEKGNGDGSQATELPVPAAPIGSSELARKSTPAEWYEIVTRGDLERYMPPFSSLTERQRWDTVAYVYSLSLPEEELERGYELYQANCAGCHGEDGSGNGPQAASLSTAPVDFTNQAFMSNRSMEDFYTAISEGTAHEMQAFADQLSEPQRWELAGYLRFMSFKADGETAAQPYPAPTSASASPEPVVTATEDIILAGDELETEPGLDEEQQTQNNEGFITGKVVNGSGGEMPEESSITLHAYDGMTAVFTDTATVDASGAFTFENVAMAPERVFFVTTDFGGTTYASNIARAQEGIDQLELQVTTYETTTDPSILSADRLHIFFDFSNPGTVQVIEFFIISNRSNKTVIAEEENGPVLSFTVPEGATNLQFQNGALGERYIEVPGGFADTMAVTPSEGEYQILFAFDMPYDNELDLVQPLNLSVDGMVVMLPEDGVKLRGEKLQDDGVRPVEGMNYHMYSADRLQAGEQLAFTITGNPSGGSALAVDSNSLTIGLGAFGAALLLAGVWLYRRNSVQDVDELEGLEDEEVPVEEEDAETLMDAIIALDDQYKEGELPEDAYLARRAELKARLKNVLGE